jgi:hypothetical protein
MRGSSQNYSMLLSAINANKDPLHAARDIDKWKQEILRGQ